MSPADDSYQKLLAENADLKIRLEEAEDTLRAIREGEVDALVVSGPEGELIFTLKGADYSYRILIEAINEGAATVALDGDILYANKHLAEILGMPLERLIGTPINNYVEAANRELFMALLEQGRHGASKGEVSLRNRDGLTVPAYLSFRSFNLEEAPGAVCLVVTDLTQQKRQEAILAEGQLSRAIFEQAEAVILVVDPEGRIIRASHEAHQLCQGNLLLRHFDEVFRLAMFDPAAKKSRTAPARPFSISLILQGSIYHSLEVSFSPSDGREPLGFLLNAGPLRGGQGEVLGAVVALTDITERKKAESERGALLANIQAQAEGLRESEERYRRLVELSPEAILVHDGSSYMYANPAAARLFGASAPEELRGMPILDLIHPSYREQTRERIQKASRGETTELRELQILSLDGRTVDVEVTGVGITYQGKPTVQVMMRDITERKRAEEAIKAAHKKAVCEKNRLEAVMEALPVGVAILDDRGGNIHANRMFEQVWGAGRPLTQKVSDYFAYKAWWVDTGKPVQPEEWASACVIKKGETVISQCMEIEGFDGTRRFVLNSAAPILDAKGKVTECAVAILDITKLKQAEAAVKRAHDELEQRVQERTADLKQTVDQLQFEIEERLAVEGKLRQSEASLRESEEIFRATFDQSPVGAAMIGLDFRFQRVNAALCTITGYSDEELTSLTFPDITHTDDVKADLAEVQRLVTGEVSQYGMEKRFIRKDGSLAWVSISRRLMANTAGSPAYLLTIFQDISARKEAENKAARFTRLYRLLSKVNEAIVRIQDQETLFRQICVIAVEEGLFKMAWIGVVDQESGLVKAVAQHGLDEGYLERIIISFREGLESRGPTGTAIREGRYDICNEINNDPRMLPWREEALRRGYRSSAAFPLRVGTMVTGSITVYAWEPGFFDHEEQGLLESLAQDVSFAMEAMEGEALRRRVEGALAASEGRLRHLAAQLIDAQEAERTRISRELHDDLGQSLMVLTLQLRGILKMVPSDQDEIRDHCNQTLTYLYEVIENVRRLARDMRPSLLEDLGLLQALRHLAASFHSYHGINVFLDMDDIGDLLRPHEDINIYRIFQESLTNIAKYAQAAQVSFTIRKLDGRISFRVEDNGRGFDMDHILAKDAPRKGLGLSAMEERVRMMGGELEIWSQEGKGTRISFSVPVAKR